MELRLLLRGGDEEGLSEGGWGLAVTEWAVGGWRPQSSGGGEAPGHGMGPGTPGVPGSVGWDGNGNPCDLCPFGSPRLLRPGHTDDHSVLAEVTGLPG